jgi:C-terminal processing protease CtpA/Prc
MAKSNHHHRFTGKLIVLADHRSASAAELFARVVQIERRGAVMGDRTSGSVMEARYCSHHTEGDPYFDPVLVYYAVMVAEAEMVMSDGNSLEHIGVIPDETILPTAADLASDRDPVMARAAEMGGVTLTPEDAAMLFPFEWPTA